MDGWEKPKRITPIHVSDVLFTYEKQKVAGLRIYEEKIYFL